MSNTLTTILMSETLASKCQDIRSVASVTDVSVLAALGRIVAGLGNTVVVGGRANLTHDNVLIMREICGTEGGMTPPSDQVDPPDQLPAIVPPAALTSPANTTYLIPALIADAGEAAGWRYVEFFTANIRNPHTRRAYARACGRFVAWCEDRGLTLTTIRPYDVATYIEMLQQTHSAPGVKQQLAAVRMLFDWLITGQVVPFNPASAVRGPKHVVKTGVTPVLDAPEWRKLIDAIPTDTVRDLRDRALIATLTYSFARIAAALTMKVGDLRPQGAGG